MDLQNVRSVASKDFETYMRKKSIIYSIVLFPLFIAIGFPALIPVILFVSAKSGGVPPASLVALLSAFSFWFITAAAILPIGFSAYSLVGEKIEKSLEPLLATPMEDSEILLGKCISAFIPPIASIYGCSLIFMFLIDAVTHGELGYLYYPNFEFTLMLVLLAPLACVLTIELSVIVSARANDVRTVQNLGGLLFIPMITVYLGAELGFIQLTTANLLLISAVFLVVDVVLFYVSKATFQREEILTKWK
jgi:ABC-2 type transport system permease protein